MRKSLIWKTAALIFTSGFCALVYQAVWLRELRLVFGLSTTATGMVLAVFMAGLGCGAVVLGKFADRARNPLALYGFLEIGITAGAALSLPLIFLVRQLYISMGGALSMGMPMANITRIFFTASILLVPTILMGGTLPAIVRFVETNRDKGRRDVAVLYGINTIGGVFGVILTTFLFIETLGNQATLGLACLLNSATACLALMLAKKDGLLPILDAGFPSGKTDATTRPRKDRYYDHAVMPRQLIYCAAFIAGFAFLLMELVWYRMLSPLLGGSTFTFGLILAVALTGIGAGSGFYGSGFKDERGTVSAFALVCIIEALFLCAPFTFGDHLAVLTAMHKPAPAEGFYAQVYVWFIVALIVVFPAAFISGIQFPMLISFMGQGKKDVGRHTGAIYGWNTLGAITGSLVGGFGLISLLSAPGCWQLVIITLIVLSSAAMLPALIAKPRNYPHLGAFVVILAAVIALRSDGPSAVWRHSGIGTAHYPYLDEMDRNQILNWKNYMRNRIIWEKDGIEGSVAIQASDGLCFMVNGKNDGNAIDDAGTQVMASLIGAILHPKPENGLVIGLGTGTSAGWLAQVPTMKKVDVVEIEPAILEVAKLSAPVNFDVLNHPKVNVLFGDGREFVQTSKQQYDIIVSEPSNPYRAGVASLYTREFYRSVKKRMTDEGYFSQWVQGYSVDSGTVRTIIATLSSEFDNVEIWFTSYADLLFVCSDNHKPISLPMLQNKIAGEPFQTALGNVWGVTGVEGFLGAFIGRREITREISEQNKARGLLNTDDRMLAEYGFARTMGKNDAFSVEKLRTAIRRRDLHRPALAGGTVDWDLVDENFFRIMLWTGKTAALQDNYSKNEVLRLRIHEAYAKGNYRFVLHSWKKGLFNESNLAEAVMLAETLAEMGDSRALIMLEENEPANRFAQLWPATAQAIRARYLWRSGEREEAFAALASSLEGFHRSPWQVKDVVNHSLDLAAEMADRGYRQKELFALLEEPFSVYQAEEYRKQVLFNIGNRIDCQYIALAINQWEPTVPWNETLLKLRSSCYKKIGSPLAPVAEKDLAAFKAVDS